MSISKATPADVEIEAKMQAPHYDRGITPAETAARQEREGANFMHTATEESQKSATTNDQSDDESIRTTDGYTVDKEGLINNYAIEPEMYINQPGDLKEQEEWIASFMKEKKKKKINKKQLSKDIFEIDFMCD